MVESLFHDIRYAVRTLRRAPLFAAAVIATIGLGLGLVGSAFTILNAYFLKPVNLPSPHELYAVSWDTETVRRHGFRLSDYETLQREARHFSRVAAVQDVTVMLDAVSTRGLLVTGNYFELLGARPALGRLLTPHDTPERGTAPVVVLSHEAWRSRYGSDPAIVGQRISLGRRRFEVVGILPPHAQLGGQEPVSFWAPLTMAGAFPGVDPWAEPDNASLVVVGRVRRDATAASLRAWLDVWLRQRFPESSDVAPVRVRLDSLATRITLDGVTLTMFVLIMSAFGLVLLVACANVTNLLLARALTRQAEVTVRLALGASRWRVRRQLIIENLVLAVPAAAAGLALIFLTSRLFPTLILGTFPAGVLPIENLLVPLDPDMRVLAFLVVAAILSAVLISLLPAGRLAQVRLVQASRSEASPDTRCSRLRSALVAMQIGACALFLVAAVGLIDESSRLANPQPNLSYERVADIRIDPRLRAAVAERLRADPAIEQVATAWKPPLMGPLPTAAATASATRVTRAVGYTVVSPEYFALFDIRITRGRAFTAAEGDSEDAVALVSEATAAALWPGRDPIGETIDLASPGRGRSQRPPPHRRVRVIGVTEDVTNGAILDGIDTSCIYLATAIGAPTATSLLMVRGRTDDLEAVKAAVAAAVNDVSPDSPFQVYPIRVMLGGVTWAFQAFSAAGSVLGIVALLLAYSGTHAVVSFLVVQRRREFGVRMALGASAWRIVRGMLLETLRTASIGLAAGLAAAAALTRVFSGAVAILPEYGVRPFAVAASIVLVATAVAALIPLGRAARIDPAQALRTE